MDCHSLEFWAVMVEIGILAVFMLAVGRSYLLQRPSVTTWRTLITVSLLFMMIGAFLVWSLAEDLQGFPFSSPSFNRGLSIFILLAGGMSTVAFCRLRAFFILHVSRGPLFQTTEAAIARSGLSWENITASVAARLWWKRPIALSQETMQVWMLKPDGPELRVAFLSRQQMAWRMGSMAWVMITGKGKRQKMDLLLNALVKDLRMITEKSDFRQAWLPLLAGIGLSVAAIFIFAMKCLA